MMSIEIYPIKLPNANILYVPVARKAAFANEDACKLIDLCRNDTQLLNHPRVKEVINSFGIEINEATKLPECAERKQESAWMPTEVTLSITSKCTLRCIYCYANGGDECHEMSWATAKSGIDWIVSNAKAKGVDKVALRFHGEGEPTSHWQMFMDCITYFRKICKTEELASTISMSSNCWLTPKQREYVISNVDSVSASFDGSPDLQDAQRPRPGGGSSSQKVVETLKDFDKHKYNYAIRATVLPQQFDDGMFSAVRWIAENIGCKEVRFEPVQPQGRGVKYKDSLDQERFLAGFIKARVEGARLGICVDYSVCNATHLKNTFCGALGDPLNMLITSHGIITTCNDVLKKSHSNASIFHIGSVDSITGNIMIDEEKLKWVRSQTVSGFKLCSNCFAKWHCAGDCFARKPDAINKENPCSENTFRCNINRTLVLNDILMLSLEGDDGEVIRHLQTNQ